MNKILIISLISVSNILYCQFICDTIYSGRSWFDHSSKSIIKELQLNLIKKEFCYSPEREDSDPKMIVPFYLNRYKNSIKDYDVIIYTLMCDYNDAPNAAIVFEIFFDSEKKAKSCLNKIDQLNKKLIDDWLHDRIPKDQNDLGGGYSPNWYFIQKENVVYFIHRVIPDTDEEPVLKVLSEELNKVLEKK
jgi:hypothetical protein